MDSFKRLLSSDRLNRDVEHLMNSSYWIDQLKSSKASGIGNKLFYQLNESQKFIKDFIKYCINIKKNVFKDLVQKLIKQETSHQKLGDYLIDLNNNISNNVQVEQIFVRLPFDFLVELVYLAILDFDDYIGNINQISSKLLNWFPDIQKSCLWQLKPIIESVLNLTPCFKRLINQSETICEDKKQNTAKPIILGKRKYTWSINQLYLKSFVKYFYKLNSSEISLNTYSINNKQDNKYSLLIPIKLNEFNQNSFTNQFNLINQQVLFQSWKFKIEQFKLLIHLKHQSLGLKWSEPLFKTCSNQTLINKINFLKLESNTNNNNSNQSLINQQSNKTNKIKLIIENLNSKPVRINRNKKIRKEKRLRKSKIVLNENRKKQDENEEQEDFLNLSQNREKENIISFDLQTVSVVEQAVKEFDLIGKNLIISSTNMCDSTICDNSSSYFNLLSIPSCLSVNFITNQLINDNNNQNSQNGSTSSNNQNPVCGVEQFLNNNEDDELRVVNASDDISINEHDKFIYF